MIRGGETDGMFSKRYFSLLSKYQIRFSRAYLVFEVQVET